MYHSRNLYSTLYYKLDWGIVAVGAHTNQWKTTNVLDRQFMLIGLVYWNLSSRTKQGNLKQQCSYSGGQYY